METSRRMKVVVSPVTAATVLAVASLCAFAQEPATQSAFRPPASAAPATSAAPKAAAPTSVQAVIQAALHTYDTAGAADWTLAGQQMVLLKAAMRQLKADISTPDAEQKKRLTQLGTDITALDKAITARRRQTSMMTANRIARVGGVLASTYASKVPQSVWQMQYLARELQVWSADPADLKKLRAIPARMDTEWARVKPELASKGDADLIKEFGDDTAQFKAASAPSDFARLAKPLLDTLDKIEKAYQQ